MSAHRVPPTAAQDQKIEIAMSNLLRIGVLLAAALVLAGGAFLLRHAGAPAPDLRHFRGADHDAARPQIEALSSMAGVFRQLTHPSSATIIELGLLVLIATPVARVIFAVVGFARERDVLYVSISVAVLAILLLSLLRGA